VGDAVEYRTPEGALKPAKVLGQNPDGTYQLSNGIKKASPDRLQSRATGTSGSRPPATKPQRQGWAAPPAGPAQQVAFSGSYSGPESQPLASGTWVDYYRKEGSARRSRIAGVNPDGTYRLRNGIARADPARLVVVPV
jgi:hypothetical protein